MNVSHHFTGTFKAGHQRIFANYRVNQMLEAGLCLQFHFYSPCPV